MIAVYDCSVGAQKDCSVGAQQKRCKELPPLPLIPHHPSQNLTGEQRQFSTTHFIRWSIAKRKY